MGNPRISKSGTNLSAIYNYMNILLIAPNERLSLAGIDDFLCEKCPNFFQSNLQSLRSANDIEVPGLYIAELHISRLNASGLSVPGCIVSGLTTSKLPIHGKASFPTTKSCYFVCPRLLIKNCRTGRGKSSIGCYVSEVAANRFGRNQTKKLPLGQLKILHLLLRLEHPS